MTKLVSLVRDFLERRQKSLESEVAEQILAKAASENPSAATAAGKGGATGIQALLAQVAIPEAGGGTPGGLDTQIQFNDGGAFGATPQLKWDKTFGLLLGDDLTPGKLSLIVQPLIDSADGEGDVAFFQSDTIGSSNMARGVYCIQLSANHGGTGRLAELGGLILGAMSNYGGGSVTAGVGIRLINCAVGDNTNYAILVEAQSGSAIENRGIYIDTVSGATFNYALQIADQGAGANDYAIKVEGGLSDFGGVVQFARLTSDPDTSGWGASDKGKTWFNTTSNVIKYWNGSVVKTVTAS